MHTPPLQDNLLRCQHRLLPHPPQVNCNPPGNMAVHMGQYRSTQGSWLRLALLDVAGDGDITGIDLAASQVGGEGVQLDPACRAACHLCAHLQVFPCFNTLCAPSNTPTIPRHPALIIASECRQLAGNAEGFRRFLAALKPAAAAAGPARHRQQRPGGGGQVGNPAPTCYFCRCCWCWCWCMLQPELVPGRPVAAAATVCKAASACLH